MRFSTCTSGAVAIVTGVLARFPAGAFVSYAIPDPMWSHATFYLTVTDGYFSQVEWPGREAVA
jgi:hypothetical protein